MGPEELVPLEIIKTSITTVTGPKYVLVQKKTKSESDTWPVGSLFTPQRMFIGTRTNAKLTNAIAVKPYGDSVNGVSQEVGRSMDQFTTPVENSDESYEHLF